MAIQNKNLKHKINIHGFTLVELIIVITILAILATIGFMSYQSYVQESKDANRISSLKIIQDALIIDKTKNISFVKPDDSIIISGNGKTIGYQGYVGTGVLKKLRMSETKDPLDNSYYTYYVNADLNLFKLAAFLENEPNKLISYNTINKANAIDYTDRYLYTVGDNIGVIIDEATNAPIQEVVDSLNLNTYTGALDLYTTDDSTPIETGTGGEILTILNVIADPNSPCIFGVSLIGSCKL